MSEVFSKKKLALDISANTLQTFITQLFGLIIFYYSSKYLSKSEFGDFSWSMAVSTVILILSTFGMEITYVKRIALNQNLYELTGIHFFHTLFSGLVLVLIVLIFQALNTPFNIQHPTFTIVFIMLTILNISSSFKLSMMGLEAYKPLAIIALATNGIKLGIILFCLYTLRFTILNTIYAYVWANVLEFLLGYFYISQRAKQYLKPLWKPETYKVFISESIPQLGILIFDSAVARLDWILLGILSTAAVTADYSFAYRMYESSKIPLTIIAPILLTRFSKIFGAGEPLLEDTKNSILNFFKWELFAVTLLPIFLVSTWAPLMDYFTNNKYGTSNELCYLLMAISVPLYCITSFMWSIGFAIGKYNLIFRLSLITTLVNVILNLILIPKFGANGAATAFLISKALQAFLHIYTIRHEGFQILPKHFAFTFINAAIAIVLARMFFYNLYAILGFTFTIYFTLAFATRQINFKQFKRIFQDVVKR